jgi:hypothetical protein
MKKNKFFQLFIKNNWKDLLILLIAGSIIFVLGYLSAKYGN